jgi:hypothetical protein
MNGSAEKHNKDIMAKGYAILHHLGLSKSLWKEYMEAANYLRNRFLMRVSTARSSAKV